MNAPAQADLWATAGTADIDGPYRYSLTRTWDTELARCLWVMLNPSKADAVDDDPTMVRCVGFAQGWGYGGIEIVNLFALISTDPKALKTATDPVGPRNDAAILAAVGRAGLVVCAWGPPGKLNGRDRAVGRLLANVRTHAVSRTKAGFPGHPLYLKATLKPFPWSPGK
jgi:hypothetical protein